MSGIDKLFDYWVPDDLARAVRVGVSVRVPLHGRRVSGWVVEDHVEAPPGVRLLPLQGVRGLGPEPEVVELARWAAWRWAGRLAAILRSASPPVLVRALPAPPADLSRTRTPARPAVVPAPAGAGDPAGAEARFAPGARVVLRLAPAADRWPVIDEAVSCLAPGRSVLILAPGVAEAGRLAERLRRRGTPVALMPEDWAAAAGGGRVVVGSRAAAWAPAPGLAAAVVLDGHEEVYKEERAPTWSAWMVVAERARRLGAPCVVTSPCPSLELLEWGSLEREARPAERAGWPSLEVIDRRGDDPRRGLFSARVVEILRGAGAGPRPMICVLNRRGRARLLACRACGELARCEVCQSPMVMAARAHDLSCPRCAAPRPPVCLSCGSDRLALIRAGVSRVVEEVQALTGREVAEVSRDVGQAVPDAAILVGTEAVLHRVRRAETVIFLDFDQELASPRLRSAEAAMALLARAARMVGGRPARLVVQTRLPDHEVLVAAADADPDLLAEDQSAGRSALGLPPYSAVALLTGEAAETAVGSLGSAGLAVASYPAAKGWLVRAPDHQSLCEALVGAAARPGIRIDVDPIGL